MGNEGGKEMGESGADRSAYNTFRRTLTRPSRTKLMTIASAAAFL